MDVLDGFRNPILSGHSSQDGLVSFERLLHDEKICYI